MTVFEIVLVTSAALTSGAFLIAQVWLSTLEKKPIPVRVKRTNDHDKHN